MKKTILILFFIVIFSNLVYAQCIEPKANLEINNDIIFCDGDYNIDDNIIINKNNINIDCNNATIIGNSLGRAFYLNEKNNVEIKNCNIENFEIGIYLEKSTNNKINNNNFKNNKFAVGLLSSENNILENNNFENNIENIFTYTINETKIIEDIIKENKTTIEQQPSNKEILIQVYQLKTDLNKEKIEEEVNNILDKYFSLTNENLIINRNFEYNPEENTTTVTLSITPKKTLYNLSLYEYIPKCFSVYLSDITFFEENFEVINEDPLIMWHFETIDKETSFSYKVNKEISEKCRELFKAFGIITFKENEKIPKSNIILPLIVLFFIILIVIYFEKFKKI